MHPSIAGVMVEESALGGWCTGGTQCTYQPIGTSCMARASPACEGRVRSEHKKMGDRDILKTNIR